MDLFFKMIMLLEHKTILISKYIGVYRSSGVPSRELLVNVNNGF